MKISNTTLDHKIIVVFWRIIMCLFDMWLGGKAEVLLAAFMDDVIATALVTLENRGKNVSK